MYNFNHLYYFYITAKSGGVGSAAKHLKISQPSLSSQLKVLERSLDVRLFYKKGRNNHLTPGGSIIYGYCRQMFEISEVMEELISQKVPSVSRRIQIGVSDEVDRPFVVEIVSNFLKRHGASHRPKVTVVSGTHEQLAERLRFRELDAVVTQLSMIDPELENIERAEVPVALTCAAEAWPQSSRSKIRFPSDVKNLIGLENLHWLMPSTRFKLRSEIDQFFAESGLKGRIVFESDVIASLVRSVIDGIGLSFLPLIYVAREIREKSVRVIGPKGGYWKYRVWLACHKQNKEDPLISALAGSFREICSMSKG